ncbi:MAG TPA: type II toxin-antitoxin system HipA family toxin [Aridibacter sp.]|nr:type II toxin-antitoxin system HipA family toxin [Aridibacter sp.]
MRREASVYLDLDGSVHHVGQLWANIRNRQESAVFQYSDEWLKQDIRFTMDPLLPATPGPFYTQPGQALFGFISDSAPDRWGKTLMRREERRRASLENRVPRTLFEIDFVLGVNDSARQGALRFKSATDGPFLADRDGFGVPPLVELARLLTAVERFEDDAENAEDMKLLLAPGSSLGGARPKASVLDRDGSLLIAKIPSKSDDHDIIRWEAVTLKLAEHARIRVEKWRLEEIQDHAVLFVSRFDRTGAARIPYLSAMTMLGAAERETHSYLEVCDAIQRFGALPGEDMEELWRRIVFTVLVSNTDDHLRNHGFLYSGVDGWRLSPMFDVNPVPVDLGPRVLATSIDLEDASASLELAMEHAAYFEVNHQTAVRIIREVAGAVARWRNVARALGLSVNEIERMNSAFEHSDTEIAASL